MGHKAVLHIFSTYNTVLITATDLTGAETLAKVSGGQVTKKGSDAGGQFAATRAAEKIEGVLAIITSKDMPETEDKMVDLGEGDENPRWTSNKLMAQQKVLYKGHPVAAVAAVPAAVK